MNFVLLIRFGDNDFRYTFEAVLRALRLWWLMADDRDRRLRFQDKTHLARLINQLLPAAYEFVQSWQFPYTGDSTQYVQITEDVLYLGEEVDEFLIEHNYDGNSAWFVLDTRLPEEQQVYIT